MDTNLRNKTRQSLNNIKRTSVQKCDEILHIAKDNEKIEARLKELLSVIEKEVNSIKESLDKIR